MKAYGHSRLLLTLALLLSSLCLPALAQRLTDAQYGTLATDFQVTHQAEFAERVAAREDQLIADAYNLVGTPDCWVYKTSVTLREVCQDTAPSGAAWDWTVYIANLSMDDKDAFKLMFSSGNGSVNPSKPNVQTAIAKIFKGTAAAVVAQRAHLDEVFRRKTTRGEKLYAAGACTTTTPATMTYEGDITSFDISQILNNIKGQ